MHKKVNKSGQTLGKKGRDTRKRLLSAATALMMRGVRPTPPDVATEAAVSTPTFYLYFKNIAELQLALCDVARADMEEIFTILDSDWHDDMEGHSHDLMLAFYTHWERHRITLAVRNHESDMGDRRFIDARRCAAMPVIQSLSDRIQQANGHRLSERDTLARSVIIYTAMERLAARGPTLEPEDLTDEELLRAEAHIVALLLRDGE
ncbi:hypothetical protein BH10PSE13_BH10PSE13_10600 [soil metagenome]